MNIDKQLFIQYNRIFPYIKFLRGTTRIRTYLKNRILKNNRLICVNVNETPIQAPTETGQIIPLLQKDPMGELDQLRYILQNIGSNEVFLDVGASFGLFSNIVSEHTDAEVHAIEPLPLNSAFLRLNKEIYERDYIVHENAAYKENTTQILHVSPIAAGRNALRENRESSSGQEIEVDAVKLNTLVDEADYIKLDVEGAELQALKGMADLLSKDPVILLELHSDTKLKAFDTDQKEVLDFLSDRGYAVPEVENLSTEEHHNLICSKSEIK